MEEGSENRGGRPKKSLGQHFLTSQGALESIARSGEVGPGDVILEIGPGKGALTKKLIAAGATVVAVEKDEALAAALEEELGEQVRTGKLAIIRGDALDFEPGSAGKLAAGYKLVANIPYYITGEILRKFLSVEPRPKLVSLLIQKEVAERIIAKDGKGSVLSISVKVFGEPSITGNVKAGSFFPRPNVDSAILKIANISNPFSDKAAETAFFSVVKAGFSQKRKLLRRNLEQVADPEAIDGAFAACGLKGSERAEELKPETWERLASHLASQQG